MNNIELQQQLEVSLSMQRSLASDLNQAQAEMEQARIAIGSLGWMTLGEAITLTMSEKDKQIAELQRKIEALAAEGAAMKSNLMYWDSEDSEPAKSPTEIAHNAGFRLGEEFEVQVAARMPNLTYRVVLSSQYKTDIELVSGNIPETPNTDAALAEIRAQGVVNFVPSDEFLTELIRASNRGNSPEEYRSAMRDVFAQQLRKEASND